MKRSRIFAMTVACLLMASAPALAKDISLAWDPNSESDLAGYKVHYRPADSSSFNGAGAIQGPSPVTVGNLTSIQIMGLDENRTWCFAVSAYNTSGLDSPLSGEVCTVAGPGNTNPGDDRPTPPGQLKPPKVKRVK